MRRGGADEVRDLGKDCISPFFRPGVLKFEHPLESPGGLVKPQIDRSTARVSDSVGLGFGPKNLHFLEFPSAANAVSLSTTLCEPLF